MSKLKATEEQLTYAKILDLGMKLGLVISVITFVIYLVGILLLHPFSNKFRQLLTILCQLR